MSTKRNLIFLGILLLSLSFKVQASVNFQMETPPSRNTIEIDSLRLLGLRIAANQPDSAIAYINKSIAASKLIKDDLRIAKGLNCLGIAYRYKNKYEDSFTAYRQALKILENSKAYDVISAIHNNQGIIYESLRLYDLAEKSYVKALQVLERDTSKDKYKFMNHTLGNLGLINRYNGNYSDGIEYFEKAIAALKKAELDEGQKEIRRAKSAIEIGMIYILLEDYPAAHTILNENRDIIENSNEKLIIADLMYYLGKLHLKESNYLKANEFLNKSLQLTKRTENKQLLLDLLRDIAHLNEVSGNEKQAIAFLRERNRLNDSLFSTENTWRIYDIKQQYENEQQQQELTLAKKEKRLSQLTKVLYFIGAIALVLFGTLYIRHLRNKHRRQKKLSRIELNRAKDILELKNKELTTSTLKIIQTGELMEYVKGNLKEISKESQPEHQKRLQDLASSIDNNTKKNWDEFKLRFEQVHTDFYKKLKDAYPALSQNELRLCSLLKLNFNSKDISFLMGISPKSVKMNRYRLRQKFHINRETNLVEFVSKF